MPHAPIPTKTVAVSGLGGVYREKVATPYGSYWRQTRGRELAARLAKQGVDSSSAAGAGGDGSFEQSFASLAYSYLKDKSPKLLDSIVGFQLVDRNEDSTKAVGVFGAKVGDEWVYVPAFFLNGELKGHELLVLAKQKVFVPNKEGWVNYLQSRRPNVLGEPSGRDAYQLGGLAPDISRLSRMPFMGKSGCDPWAAPFLPPFAAMATDPRGFVKRAGDGPAPDLRGRAFTDPRFAHALARLAGSYPGVKAALDRFYGPRFLKEAGESLLRLQAARATRLLPDAPAAAPRPRFPGLLPTPAEKAAADVVAQRDAKLKVYDDAAVTRNLPDLTDAERTELAAKGRLIKDERDPHAVSTVYDTQVEQRLATPDETGVYEVLERPGSFGKFLVVAHPHTNRGREDVLTAVRLSGSRAYLNVRGPRLWARQDREGDYRGWFEGLDKGGPEVGSCYVAVGPDGDGTAPFEVRGSYGDGCYRVSFDCHADWRHDRPTSPRQQPRQADGDWANPYDAVLRVNARPGSSLRSVSGTLYVPGTFKFLKVRDGRSREAVDDPPVQPGSVEDIQLLFHEKTAGLAVHSDGREYHVEGRSGLHRFGRGGALVHLVRDHGLREKQAEAVLDAADRSRRAAFRVKYAEPYPFDPMQPGPSAPPLPPPLTGAEYNGPKSVPAVYPQEELLPVPSLDSGRTDPSVYDPWRNYEYDPRGVGAAQSAAGHGDKELFDTAALATLTKALGQDVKGEQDLPVLMRALDKLGRRLFQLYWHGEDYEERYGKHDMPELEDAMRNAFLVLGDVVLKLKQGSVTPVFSGLGDNDLGDAAQN